MFVAICALLGGVFSETHAQQTIFNVPSTDVLDKGKVYGEFDASFKPTDSDAVRKCSSFVPRGVVGAGSNVEVGSNISDISHQAEDSLSLVPGIKWKPYHCKNNGV